MNSLLLSMPGTPVIYYGDEIGMGDNIYLGDRDGVRTPMQWSVDRNGGFSRADPGQALSCRRSWIRSTASAPSTSRRSSPIRWSLLDLDAAHDRGAALQPRARPRHACASSIRPTARCSPICARSTARRILCVANVSRAPQAVELDLAEFEGAAPVELTAGSPFPPIGSAPYVLTLPAYGFIWFRLEAVKEERQAQQPVPELFTLVATGKIETIFAGRELVAFERDVAPKFLSSRRWVSARRGPIPACR